MNMSFLRDEFNLVQKDLSKYLGIDRSFYSKHETMDFKDYLEAKTKVFIKLALLYNVRLEYIFGLSSIKGEFIIDDEKELIKQCNIDPYLLKKLRLEKHKYDYDYSEGSKK